MKITRVSQISGIERTMDINVTQEQLDKWEDGEFIQRVMPHLTTNEREFIMTGITSEEWDHIFERNIYGCDEPGDDEPAF